MYRGIRRTMKINRTRPEPAVKEIQNSEKNEGCRTGHSREYAPIYTGFSRFFAVLLLFIFVSVILLNPEDPAFAPGRSLLTMCIYAAVTGLICFLYCRIAGFRKFTEDKEKVVLAVFFAILILLQVRIILSIHTIAGWDCGIIVYAVLARKFKNYQLYFSVYPNNRFLLFMVELIARVTGRNDGIWIKLDFLNIVALDTSMFLTYRIVKKLHSRKWAYLSLLLSFFVYGLNGYLIIPYTDTFGMPFTIGAYDLLLKTEGETDGKKKKLRMAGLAVFMAFAYWIKPTTVILMIAYVMVRFAAARYGRNLRKLFSSVMLVLVFTATFAGMNIGKMIFEQTENIIIFDDRYSMTPMHYVMMGLNRVSTGGYLQSDSDFSISSDPASVKAGREAERIGERLARYGPSGYADFLFRKLRTFMGDGTFFWGKEGSFAEFKDVDKGDTFLKNIYYTNGSSYEFYRYAAQGIWLFILLLCGAGLFTGKSDRNRAFVNLTVFGLILFLLIFEQRSRYLILYLPYFIMAAVFSVKDLSARIGKSSSAEAEGNAKGDKV